MCTVTYAPTENGFVFTSNRDEQPLRATNPPTYYEKNGLDVFYPKDMQAGGTWVGVSSEKRLVCLLNGGFVYHNPQLKFPRSRGVVVTELLTSTSLENSLEKINLEGVAPFTLLVVDWKDVKNVYELVWCSGKKNVTKLDIYKPYVWSSSTLYTQEMKDERKEWFQKEVLLKEGDLEQRVLGFHQNETLGTVETSPKMKRAVVETISTTMIVANSDSLRMDYWDYVSGKEYKSSGLFEKIKA